MNLRLRMYEYYCSNLGAIYAKVYEILGAQHLILKKWVFQPPKAKLSHLWHPGSTGTQS